MGQVGVGLVDFFFFVVGCGCSCGCGCEGRLASVGGWVRQRRLGSSA